MHESSTLQPLLAHNDPHAFARDIDATGKKKYFGGDLEHMAKMYERTPHKHWYEVIRADRGTRIFLDIESTAKSRDEVLRGVHSLMKVMKALVKVFADIDEEFYLLDSSDDKKASFHVVGAHLYLKDVFSVGALVRRCWCALKCIENGSVKMEGVYTSSIFEMDGDWIVDDQIYNKNRCFRVAFSHKMGSARVLMPCETEDTLTSQDWRDYLVQRVEPSDLCCKEIDGSGPITTSRRAMDVMCLNDDGNWSCEIMRNKMDLLSNYTMPECVADAVTSLEEVDPNIRKDSIRFSVQRHSWLVPSMSKKCAIAGREHKSNHVWYEVRLGEVRQFCHDAKCNGYVNMNVDMDLWVVQWLTEIDTEELIRSAHGGL